MPNPAAPSGWELVDREVVIKREYRVSGVEPIQSTPTVKVLPTRAVITLRRGPNVYWGRERAQLYGPRVLKGGRLGGDTHAVHGLYGEDEWPQWLRDLVREVGREEEGVA